MPMNASCGTFSWRMRVSAKTAAPTKVNPSENRYTVVASPCSGSYPSSTATVEPSAAICASVRSTKMTLRLRTWIPR